MVKITGVLPRSPAERAGIRAGDFLLSIDGHSIHDVLDYQFYATSNHPLLSLRRGTLDWDAPIAKDEYDDLGLTFETFLMDEKQSCRNHCVFCFIDQMPPGMRPSLYFKDDDARLSFLQGNYVTLTNLSQEDVDRIIRMKLHIRVSVHTTNPDLRCAMMGNRFAGKSLDFLWQMANAGLSLDCQLVLCPGLNDGEELVRTLCDLGEILPGAGSASAVPVGLTRYRDGLYPLSPFTPQGAAAVIDIIEDFQADFLKKCGSRTVFPSDEFFLLAHRSLPRGDYYEDYPQFENGVGMLRSLADEFETALSTCLFSGVRRVSLATGEAAFPFLQSLIDRAKTRFPGLFCNIYPIHNHFFGDAITVAGLITGQDLTSQLEGCDLGEELLISQSMLRAGEDVFLDDWTLTGVSETLKVPVRPVPNDGGALLDALLGW